RFAVEAVPSELRRIGVFPLEHQRVVGSYGSVHSRRYGTSQVDARLRKIYDVRRHLPSIVDVHEVQCGVDVLAIVAVSIGTRCTVVALRRPVLRYDVLCANGDRGGTDGNLIP